MKKYFLILPSDGITFLEKFALTEKEPDPVLKLNAQIDVLRKQQQSLMHFANLYQKLSELCIYYYKMYKIKITFKVIDDCSIQVCCPENILGILDILVKSEAVAECE